MRERNDNRGGDKTWKNEICSLKAKTSFFKETNLLISLSNHYCY